MNYNTISDREVLIKEYELINKQIITHINIFNKIAYMVVGVAISLVPTFVLKPKLINNVFMQIKEAPSSHIIPWLFILGAMLLVSEYFTKRRLDNRKQAIINRLELLECQNDKSITSQEETKQLTSLDQVQYRLEKIPTLEME